jgi:hypothetical protein
MAEEEKAQVRLMTETEQMHKFSRDQVAEFQKANREEREKRIADARKEAEAIRARVEKKHADQPAPPEGEAGSVA